MPARKPGSPHCSDAVVSAFAQTAACLVISNNSEFVRKKLTFLHKISNALDETEWLVINPLNNFRC